MSGGVGRQATREQTGSRQYCTHTARQHIQQHSGTCTHRCHQHSRQRCGTETRHSRRRSPHSSLPQTQCRTHTGSWAVGRHIEQRSGTDETHTRWSHCMSCLHRLPQNLQSTGTETSPAQCGRTPRTVDRMCPLHAHTHQSLRCKDFQPTPPHNRSCTCRHHLRTALRSDMELTRTRRRQRRTLLPPIQGRSDN